MNPGQVRLIPNHEEVVADVLGGEAVIINIAQGFYYGTKGLGGWIWESIGKGSSIDQVAHHVAVEYAMDLDQARSDTAMFFDSLVAERLVVEAPPEGSEDSDAANLPVLPPGPYEKPSLDIYRDMKDLLALDPPMPMLSSVGENR